MDAGEIIPAVKNNELYEVNGSRLATFDTLILYTRSIRELFAFSNLGEGLSTGLFATLDDYSSGCVK